MKRSVIVGATALVAGLLLAITAFSAPFRSYDRAAGDQYTTPPGCTNGNGNAGENNPNCGTTSTPPPGCENGNGGARNPNCPPAPTTAVAGQSAAARTGDVEGVSASGGGSPEPAVSGTAPDEAQSVAGAPGGAGGGSPGSGSGSGRAAAASTLAFLFVGEQPDKLGATLLKLTGQPTWAAAVTDASALRTDRLTGLARGLGGDTVTASGISGRLPDLVDVFDGAVKPITGIVLARTAIADPAERRRSEAFQRAFAAGALQADIPVIGVELNGTSPSSIPYFKAIKGASSIDDIDTRRGAVSLSRLLAGATPGHFGRQASARASTPPTIDARAASSPLQEGGGSLGDSPLLVGLLLTMALLGGRALVGVVRRTRIAR